MELKYGFIVFRYSDEASFNCTFMELKWNL